jgi:hypothetical protein
MKNNYLTNFDNHSIPLTMKIRMREKSLQELSKNNISKNGSHRQISQCKYEEHLKCLFKPSAVSYPGLFFNRSSHESTQKIP